MPNKTQCCILKVSLLVFFPNTNRNLDEEGPSLSPSILETTLPYKHKNLDTVTLNLSQRGKSDIYVKIYILYVFSRNKFQQYMKISFYSYICLNLHLWWQNVLIIYTIITQSWLFWIFETGSWCSLESRPGTLWPVCYSCFPSAGLLWIL